MNVQTSGRRSIRLKEFDYSGSATYFVTLCTEGRRHRFGEIEDGFMILNAIGFMVEREWLRSALIRPELNMHSFVVMPNHLHGLCTVNPIAAANPNEHQDAEPDLPNDADRVGPIGSTPEKDSRRFMPRSLGSFIGGFKAATTRQYRDVIGNPDGSLWQRGYYEHVVRDEFDFARIGGYIANNPFNWQFDTENTYRSPQ